MVLKLRVNAPELWERAKCLGKVNRRHDDPLFEDPWFDDEPNALEFCNSAPECPLRNQCLLFALTNNEKSGTWGGMNEIDRKALRKRWPLKGARVPRPEWEWFPPGEPASWYGPQALREELDKEIEEDDD